jgi:hypothetical protein
MDSKQRLYTAVDGGVPDRVPVVPKIWVDLACRLTGIELTEVLEDPFTALEVIAEAGLLCGVDAVRQFHFPGRRIRRDGERVLEVSPAGARLGEIDMQGGLMTRLDSAAGVSSEDPLFMAYNHYYSAPEPLVNNLREAGRIAVPEKGLYEELGCGERQRAILARYGERLAFIGDCDSATLAFLATLRGMNRALVDLIEEPRLVHAIMARGAAVAVEKGKFNLDAGLKVLRLNDSPGNMDVISPAHWREFVYPHIRDVCAELHAYDPASRVYCHICGNILPVAEDLAQSGLDCIGPLDPLGGFTPAQIRERVGDAVSLMGGVNTLSFLARSPEQIVTEAAACIRQAGGRGGYVLSSGCVVPRDAPRESLQALRTAAERCGVYREGKLEWAS